MKFKVYPISEDNQTQYFKLRESGDRIDLITVNQDGRVLVGGCILSLSDSGIRLHSCVNNKL